ncbi:hypothetical protein ACGH7X_13995 [Streptomyces sp. BBFR51]|uniref:hypothetical protein n=1 Tax=Streptomyces sp. BBFR51 TaxID=3372856 RepID=UPI0037DD16CF
MTVEISGGTDGIGRGDRVVAVGTDRAEAEPGARFQRPGRTKTADGAGRFETAVKEIPGPQASSLADARRLYDRAREVLAR